MPSDLSASQCIRLPFVWHKLQISLSKLLRVFVRRHFQPTIFTNVIQIIVKVNFARSAILSSTTFVSFQKQ